MITTILLVVANVDFDYQVHLSKNIQECDSKNAISLRMTRTNNNKSTKNRRGRVLLCVLRSESTATIDLLVPTATDAPQAKEG